MTRTKLGTADEVYVWDCADGDLYYGEMTEDGERPVLRPDRAATIRLTTDAGEVYELDKSFGDDFWNAEAFAVRIRQTGHVNLDCWRFVRYIYGSRAYESSGEEFARAEQEREDAKWEPKGSWNFARRTA